MFCKHSWELLSETTTESKLEHISRLAKETTLYNLEEKSNRLFIQIVSCKKCGALKRFVERI